MKKEYLIMLLLNIIKKNHYVNNEKIDVVIRFSNILCYFILLGSFGINDLI